MKSDEVWNTQYLYAQNILLTQNDLVIFKIINGCPRTLNYSDSLEAIIVGHDFPE